MNKYVLSVVALLAAVPASAATITFQTASTPPVAGAGSSSQNVALADVFGTFNTTIPSLDTPTYDFSITADEDLGITANALTGNGLASDLDSFEVTLTVAGALTETEDFTVVTVGSGSIGFGFFDDFVLLEGQTATVSFDFTAPSQATTIDWSFNLTPVPVPASLPLILAGLGALGVVRRKA